MKTINSSELKPLKMETIGDKRISFNSSTDENFYTNDGYYMCQTEFLNNMKDIVLYGNSVLGLTDKMDISELIMDETHEIDNSGVYYFTYYDVDIETDGVWGYDYDLNIVMTTMDKENAIGFTLVHHPDRDYWDNYNIVFGNYALEFDYNDTGTFFIAKSNDNPNQRFGVLAGSSSLNDVYIIGTIDGTHLSLPMSGLGYDNPATVDNRQFKTYNYKSEQIEVLAQTTSLSGAIIKNDWVRYKNFYTPIYSSVKSNLEIDEETVIENIPLNYLVIGGTGEIDTSNKVAIGSIDLVPLKNIYTTAYDLFIGRGAGITSTIVDNRDYTRIYLNENSTRGYPMPILSYSTIRAYNIPFKKDEYTYFHIPTDIGEMSIHDCGFKESGAVFGVAPAFSDRVYKMLGNYEDHIWWGGGKHNNVQDGTWLCAWLSGNIGTGESTWMERYYDPQTFTESIALSSEPDSDGIIDVESTMTIEEKAYYKYFHVGNKTHNTYSEYSYNIANTSIIVKYVKYDTGETILNYGKDQIPGIISDIDNSIPVDMDVRAEKSVSDSGILLYGNSDIYISDPTHRLKTITKELSIVSWIYLDDLSEKRSTSVYNYFNNGGYKLEFINKGLYSSYIIPNIEIPKFDTVTREYYYSMEGLSGQYLLLKPNSDIEDEYITTSNFNVDIKTMLVDSDGCGILGGKYLNDEDKGSILIKLNNDGTFSDSIKLKTLNIERLMLLDDNTIIGKDEDVEQTGSSDWYSINPYTYTVTESGEVSANAYPYLTPDGDLDWVENVRALDVYLDGTVCKITTDNKVYIGNDVIFQTTPYRMVFKDIVTYENDMCIVTASSDVVNEFRLYVLHKKDNYSIRYNAYINTDLLFKADEYTNVPFISYEKQNGKLVPILYWCSGDFIHKYIIKENFEIENISNKKLDNVLYNTNSVIGDYSGYKYNKIMDLLNDKKSQLKLSMITTDELEPKKSVNISSDKLDNGWNMISSIMNKDYIRMYLNSGTIYSEITGSEMEIKYDQNSAFSIGGVRSTPRSLYSFYSMYNYDDIRIGIGPFSIYDIDVKSDIEKFYSVIMNRSVDMSWSVYSGEKELEEEISKFYKFKKPGFKTKKMNIVINNFNEDDGIKNELAEVIKNSVEDILDANSDINEIKWR